MSDLVRLSLSDASARLQDGGLSSLALTEACIEQVGHWSELNALVTPLTDEALRQAERADARIQAGQRLGPLDGVPIGLKDVFCTEGVRTTAGSRILEQHVPVYDAAVVEKLKAAGAEIDHASPEFVAELKTKLAFVEEDWIGTAAKRGVDGKAALAYFREQAQQNK